VTGQSIRGIARKRRPLQRRSPTELQTRRSASARGHVLLRGATRMSVAVTH